MRIHQLGCRYVCTQSPDGELRYLRATRLSSLRLFWIFRNFADLHQHVLSPGQLQLILNCEPIDDARIKPEELIGTIELSAGPTKGFEMKSRPSIRATQPVAHMPMPSRSFAISAIATAAAIIFVALTFSVAQAHWTGRLGEMGSKSKQVARSLLPRVHSALRFRIVEPQQAKAQRPFSNPEQVGSLPSPSAVWAKAETREGAVDGSVLTSEATLQSAAYKYASANESALAPDVGPAVPHTPPKHSSASLHHSDPVPQILPPAGPPESHPVLDDFSSVVRDTEVLLRAIVSPEGRVKEVKLLHGDATLGREAARIVRSWRYASRTGNTDGESRIRFQFTSDVTTVSFLDSGLPLQNR